MTGLGLTWTPVRTQCSGRDTVQLAMFWAFGSPTADALVHADLGASFTGSAVIVVDTFSGVDPSSPLGATSWANTAGTDGDPPCSGGVDTMTNAWSTLDSTMPDSRIVAGIHTAREKNAPSAGFTELADVQSADTMGGAGVATESRQLLDVETDITIAGSFTGNPDWIGIAVELHARR